MSVYLLKSGKNATDAEKYLKNLRKKQKDLIRQKEEENLKEVSPLETFIKTRQTLIEIEKKERDTEIQSRSSLQRAVKIQNSAKTDSKLSKIAEDRVKMKKKQEMQRIQAEKKAATEAKIEKIKERQEKKLVSARKNFEDQQKKTFERSQNVHEKNETLGISESNTIITPSDAWTMAPCEVRDVLLTNYKEIKQLKENIDSITSLLNSEPEADSCLLSKLTEKIHAEKESLNSQYQKKLEKKVSQMENFYLKEIGRINEEISNLKQSLSLSYLATKK